MTQLSKDPVFRCRCESLFGTRNGPRRHWRLDNGFVLTRHGMCRRFTVWRPAEDARMLGRCLTSQGAMVGVVVGPVPKDCVFDDRDVALDCLTVVVLKGG